MASWIPKTHNATMFKEQGRPLVIEEMETKQPVEGEILIKVLAAGVCRSDAIMQAGAFDVSPCISISHLLVDVGSKADPGQP